MEQKLISIKVRFAFDYIEVCDSYTNKQFTIITKLFSKLLSLRSSKHGNEGCFHVLSNHVAKILCQLCKPI